MGEGKHWLIQPETHVTRMNEPIIKIAWIVRTHWLDDPETKDRTNQNWRKNKMSCKNAKGYSATLIV